MTPGKTARTAGQATGEHQKEATDKHGQTQIRESVFICVFLWPYSSGHAGHPVADAMTFVDHSAVELERLKAERPRERRRGQAARPQVNTKKKPQINTDKHRRESVFICVFLW